MNSQNESQDDFLAKQNLEEEKPFWIINQKKNCTCFTKDEKIFKEN